MSDSTRAARISAAAALIGALVGVLGASVPAYVQAQSAREVESSRFYREKQYLVYEEFNLRMRPVADRVAALGPLEKDFDPSKLGVTPSQLSSISDSTYRISLVGSEPATTYATKSTGALRQLLSREGEPLEKVEEFLNNFYIFQIEARGDLAPK